MEKELTFQELCEQSHQRELEYNKEMDGIIHAEEKAYLAHIRESLGSLVEQGAKPLEKKEEKNAEKEDSEGTEVKIAQRKRKKEIH